MWKAPRGALVFVTMLGCGEAPARQAPPITSSAHLDASVPDAAEASLVDAAAATFADAAPSADAAQASPADAGEVVRTGGCGVPTATGLQSVTTMVGGVSRHYSVFVPSGYDASTPTRLIFVFHGMGGDGAQIRSYLSFEREAGAGALFVYPDGVPVAAAGGRTGWDTPDLLFFDAMVAEISAAYCVDPARIFATGHSFGAYMTNEVGCQRGGVVKAIAAVSGGTLGSACHRPVAAWLAHGDRDDVVAQSEGIAARDHWLATDGCSSVSAPTTPSPCVTYNGCAAGAPVTWCSFAGGHYPPFPAFVRPAIWAFFQSW